QRDPAEAVDLPAQLDLDATRVLTHQPAAGRPVVAALVRRGEHGAGAGPQQPGLEQRELGVAQQEAAAPIEGHATAERPLEPPREQIPVAPFGGGPEPLGGAAADAGVDPATRALV